jgi:hypothetical protein
MEKTEMSLLEKEIEKSVKVRERIAKIIVDNYPIERDFADVIALDTVNQAIGTDRLEEYNAEKQRLARIKQAQLENEQFWARVKTFFRGLGIGVGGLIPLSLVLWFLFWAVTGMYACATAPEQPYTHKAIPEQARFVDEARSTWTGNQVYGLHNDNNLCLTDFSPQKVNQPVGSGIYCIHKSKAESLNKAMDKAVAEDFNGVVWNEPNGNGTIWTVERNNYRFVVTSINDPEYK